MSTLEEAVHRLRDGRPVSFLPTDVTVAEAKLFVDCLEHQVGLPLERREIIDVRGYQIVVWVAHLCNDPLARKFSTGVTDGSVHLDAD